MMRDTTEFRQRFADWKAGEKVYDAGRPISNDEYYSIMERVAKENWLKWGDSSEDAALTRILNANDYDYRGYYNKYPESRANADTHWNDEFKTVYHPTFSEESRYSGKKSKFNPEGLKGGSWGENDKFYPQNWLMFGTKYPNLKMPLPKYDGGTDDKIYLPEYEYESTFGGYDKGKSIHINPANRGKFNATKKRTGKTTEQLVHSKNPLTRKRAIFALNARKWHH